ncbi:MAG: alpha/beta hydrolase [Oculatellaceae cyanobacterium Prado106]|jgi:hypothetical protein|nr:alpha/beta hydrolase [Oculatellaceae cyanobacterium Prado106]
MARGSKFVRQWVLGEWSVMRLGRSLLIIYACICLYVFFFADQQIFLPPPASYGRSPEILQLETTDRVKIAAVYLPNPAARYTLLYSHGNAEDLGLIRPLLKEMRAAGFAVMAYDYRGYGLSQGRPSEAGSYRDIAAVYQYLRETLRVPSEQIVVVGRSLGGAISTHLVAQQPVAGLVLESTFTKAFRVILPFPIFPFEKFPSIDRLKSIRCPLLMIHGTDDRTIPLWHGQALYDAAAEPKQFWWVEGADHNDLTLVAGAEYFQKLREFVGSLSGDRISS